MTYARCAGVNPARTGFLDGCPDHASEDDRSTTGTPVLTGVDNSCPCVRTMLGALSSTRYASRSDGYDGSNGKYAPPAFSTASSATTIDEPRSTQIATRSSGFTPSSR